MPWKTFLKAHWGAIAAADFFSVEVLTRGGLVRYLVLFVIDLKSRRVHVAGVTSQADGCRGEILISPNDCRFGRRARADAAAPATGEARVEDGAGGAPKQASCSSRPPLFRLTPRSTSAPRRSTYASGVQ